MVLLVLVARASAEECLTGAATLGDRRALAALREATDAACPCASFDGTSGNGRSAYRRCARAVRDAALAAAELRPECRAVATRGYLDATCGAPGKVACGRVTPTSRTRPVSCRIVAADECRDRGLHHETVCAGETHCADVVEWTAGTCVDPRVRGPFEAGARTVTFTKTSVESGEPRPLDTVIWYPATPAAGAIDPAVRAVRDAPLAASGAPYPLLLFSHGLCGSPLQSLFLTPLLAAQGFVVVAPPHPGNTTADFPTCATPQSQVSSYRERPHDVVFVLDRMLAENDDPSSPFFAAIDRERVAMAGHSFGGLTTYLVEDLDPRIKVAIPMAPAVIGSPALAIPSLTMLAQLDGVVANPAIRAAYAASEAPKALVELEHAGHYAFSDFCRAGSDCNPPVTATPEEAHEMVLRWVRPFLELHLNGDQSFAPFLLAAPPGVALQTEAK
jgi:predicted dienelactone hydrolase